MAGEMVGPWHSDGDAITISYSIHFANVPFIFSLPNFSLTGYVSLSDLAALFIFLSCLIDFSLPFPGMHQSLSTMAHFLMPVMSGVME